VLYPDPNDTANIGAIRAQILPVNPFALAALTATSTALSVTGWVGTQVVALDADVGAIVAAAFSSGSCNAASPPTQFDGTYDLEHLPVGRNYNLYAGQLVAIALPSDFDVPADFCSQDGPPSCVAPVANTNFNVRTLPASRQLKLYGIVRTLEWRKAYDDIWLFTLALK
jgi:hypothetical protein